MTTERIRSATIALVVSIAVVGCATTTQTGAAIGGIGGALLGGGVGSAIVGAAAGAGIGYLTDREKQNALQADREERRALQESSLGDDPDTAYTPANENPLVGSTWRVISVQGYDELKDTSQVIISFQTNSKVTTMISHQDGNSVAYVESYGLVENFVVFSGTENGEQYSVAARYVVANKLMTLSIDEARLVLQEVEESGNE